jgi:hypothetical protein
VFSETETVEVQKMVADLISMEAIVLVDPLPDQFVSQLFLVTNKDLSKRPILNVKEINENFLPCQHFKIKSNLTSH